MTRTHSMTAGELQEGWKRLCQRWYETTQIWDDRVRWQFQNEFWQPLETQSMTTHRELERLANCIAKARRSVR